MSEYHNHQAGLEKQLQALMYTGSVQQLCTHWSGVVVCRYEDVVLTKYLPHVHVPLTVDVLNCLDQQTVNQ